MTIQPPAEGSAPEAADELDHEIPLATGFIGFREWDAERLKDIDGGVKRINKSSGLMRIVAGLVAAMVTLACIKMLAIDHRFDAQKNNGDVTRALLCENNFYDNDRLVPLDPVCFTHDVIEHYAPGFCEQNPTVCVAIKE